MTDCPTRTRTVELHSDELSWRLPALVGSPFPGSDDHPADDNYRCVSVQIIEQSPPSVLVPVLCQYEHLSPLGE